MLKLPSFTKLGRWLTAASKELYNNSSTTLGIIKNETTMPDMPDQKIDDVNVTLPGNL